MKSCWKNLSAARGFDGGGDFRQQHNDGLSELTMRQNPNLKNSDLFYGFDTMLREEILLFSLNYKGRKHT